jgi:hypothetical protein
MRSFVPFFVRLHLVSQTRRDTDVRGVAAMEYGALLAWLRHALLK